MKTETGKCIPEERKGTDRNTNRANGTLTGVVGKRSLEAKGRPWKRHVEKTGKRE